MSLTTSLQGRVRNTSLPISHALMPLEEAVVNAIQAIDAGTRDGTSGEGRVVVQVVRSGQHALDFGGPVAGVVPQEPITGFIVTDNGVGFTAENMASFETLDSDYKSAMGSRGVGRLLWLKAFDHVSVESTYLSPGGAWRRREFSFDDDRGIFNADDAQTTEGPSSTTVRLNNFREKYRKEAPKTVDSIARGLLDHCLWYFIRDGGAPQIIVRDDDSSVNLDELMEGHASAPGSAMNVDVKGVSFTMINLRVRSGRAKEPILHWCAASRVVKNESLKGKPPGMHAGLKDASGTFTFECFLSSKYLDTGVRSDRTAFDIPEEFEQATLQDEPSLADIRRTVLDTIEGLLAEELAVARDAGKERVTSFVSHRAPRYRPVLTRFDEGKLTVDPAITDDKLELELHRQLQDFEHDLLKDGQTILEHTGQPDHDTYQERLNEYIERLDAIKQSDLVAYVARRRVVLDILAKLVEADRDGRYAAEHTIHNLLMQMRTDSNGIEADASNLWIIDERLAFHEYLASDKPLSAAPVTGSQSTKEPDIFALRLGEPVLVSEGTQLPLASIVVIEIKKPMRNDARDDEKNPISQALDYLERIRDGGVTTSSGRLIPRSESIPGFCYVIADLTKTMVNRCKDANLRPTADGLGYFGFNEARGAYVEIISYDRLINAAKERNRAFFDKLGLPT